MKRLLIVAVVLALGACKVEKTGHDTYKVTAPTPEAKSAGEKAKEQAKDFGQKVEKGAAEAAQSAGAALQKVGQKAEEHMTTRAATATSTSATVTATTTTTTTTTERRESATKHH